MKSLFFSALFGCLFSLSAHATAGTSSGGGLGPHGVYAHCAGQLQDGTKVTFEVRATAAPNIVDSVLLTQSNELIAHLYCEKGSDVVPGVPSAGTVKWNCGKTALDQNIDGGIIVVVAEGGVTGVTTAKVYAEQMPPLPPQDLGSLLCK